MLCSFRRPFSLSVVQSYSLSGDNGYISGARNRVVFGLLEDCIGVCEFQLPAFCQQEEEVAIRIILSDTMLP